MADDESSDDGSRSSSEESEDIAITGLVATRAKRQTAGNRYEANLGDFDDPDIQALFVEVDGESEDYEGTDQDGDDDDAMDSSSSDEDAGPPKEGDAEDLEGEKELKKAERAEQNKKRKAQQAKLSVPAWAKKAKRVTLANEVHADDGSSSAIDAPARKKKSERKDWRLNGIDAPTRQSARSSAVAFRETIHVNLQESAERSRKHKTALNETKRERVNRRVDLTLEERLEKCRNIEKETAKELGRFEREEAERVRLREEALMAKRRRVLDGPMYRTLTTSGLYENGKLKIKRLTHGSQPVEDILAEEEQNRIAALQAEVEEADIEMQEEVIIPGTDSQDPPTAQQPLLLEPANSAERPPAEDDKPALTTIVVEDADTALKIDEPLPDADEVEGMTAAEPAHEIESSSKPSVNEHDGPSAAVSTEVKVEVDDIPDTDHKQNEDTEQDQSVMITSDPAATAPDNTEIGDASAAELTSLVKSVQRPSVAEEEQVPAPIVREQAQRHLLTLQDFPNLEGVVTKRSKATSALEPSPVAQVLMPDSYPTFTDEEATYLRKNRKSKQELYPKQLCALTSWQGKYRDPNTGIVFADVPAYKMLQRLIAGGCRWNSMLECWSAPFVGLIGRPAHGVPEGFDVPRKTPGKEAS